MAVSHSPPVAPDAPGGQDVLMGGNDDTAVGLAGGAAAVSSSPTGEPNKSDDPDLGTIAVLQTRFLTGRRNEQK